MGMGEPLLNLAAVRPALEYMNTVLGIGMRHITVSTVGRPLMSHSSPPPSPFSFRPSTQRGLSLRLTKQISGVQL